MIWLTAAPAIFVESIKAVRRKLPLCSVEVLIPDFQANWDALQAVMDAKPDILNHNIETGLAAL